MLVLIAVHPHHHLAPAHAGRAVDGELVMPVLVECHDRVGCPCRSSWAGVVTTGFSGLAEVADRPNLTRGDVRRAVHDLLDAVGWIDDVVQAVEAGDIEFDGVDIDDPVWAVERMIDDHMTQIATICATFPVGSVLSRFGDLVSPTVESRQHRHAA